MMKHVSGARATREQEPCGGLSKVKPSAHNASCILPDVLLSIFCRSFFKGGTSDGSGGRTSREE